METILGQLQTMRNHFNSGATRSYQFRKQNLKALYEALRRYEPALMRALYDDLKKARKNVGLQRLVFYLLK
jgi:aldehyde dehydrogenase (NAD+)